MPMPRRTRVALVIGGLAAALLAWEAVTSVVAYTADAFVDADLIAVAPQVSGPILAVAARNDQAVAEGDLLFTIDPLPFQLATEERAAQIAEARANLAADFDAIAAAQDDVREAQAAADLAQTTQRRIAELARSDDAARAQLDQANEAAVRQQAALQARQAAVDRAQAVQAAHQAALASAQASLAIAQWQLDRTQVRAPVAGRVNNLTLRPGDTARAAVPMLGVVAATGWRIVANYPQSYLPALHAGQTVWVWLDSQPWHFHRGRIAGIAAGIARSPEQPLLLPYVAPTTDWIRLQRRFPVTIDLVDPPPGLRLFMGADARTVIFP